MNRSLQSKLHQIQTEQRRLEHAQVSAHRNRTAGLAAVLVSLLSSLFGTALSSYLFWFFLLLLGSAGFLTLLTAIVKLWRIRSKLDELHKEAAELYASDDEIRTF